MLNTFWCRISFHAPFVQFLPQILIRTGQFASDWRGRGKDSSGDRESDIVPDHLQCHDQRKLLKIHVQRRLKQGWHSNASQKVWQHKRKSPEFQDLMKESFMVSEFCWHFLTRQACRDFLALAQTHSKRWQKALQAEREQRVRLEETLEQLAKQHNHLERAFRGAAQANTSADKKGDIGSSSPVHTSLHPRNVAVRDT